MKENYLEKLCRQITPDPGNVILKIRLFNGAEYDFHAHELTPCSVQLEEICKQLKLQGKPILLDEDDDVLDSDGLRLCDICDKEQRFTLLVASPRPPQIRPGNDSAPKLAMRRPADKALAAEAQLIASRLHQPPTAVYNEGPADVERSRRDRATNSGQLLWSCTPADCAPPASIAGLAETLRIYLHRLTRLLLRSSASINLENAAGNAPLHLSIQHSSTPMVKLLLRCAASMELRRSYDGLTALAVAVSHSRATMARLLLQHKAMLHEPRTSRTALHVAAALGKLPFMSMLTKAGADSIATDNQGKVPAQLLPNGITFRQRFACKRIKTIPPTPLMASHYGSELSRTIANVFVDTVRELPAYFNIQQPLQLRHMHAETADNVRKLTNHMQLNLSDAHWLQCLSSELHPEAGHALIPDLWELKRRVSTAVERQH
ncbi:Ankyrin repeat domain-containing protein 6 [Symbiodinium microadriaticum]|uniref:Ankyrin repeat domain-containing protein 6 n=1 Tax=Symbiodinium microadriaticum TaxID=2951 RepID=A0A1Q9C541_SYMMI|nr:Ankyrin repeat domain-containing protein 6 [Symbiodinium microadriaticum]